MFRNKSNLIILGFICIYIIANLLLYFFSVTRNNFDLLYLSLALGAPFFIGMIFSYLSNSDLIRIFSASCLISGWLSPLGFFYEKDKFTYGGFSAVKSFNFSVTGFINNYYYIVISYFIILFLSFLTIRNGQKMKTIQFGLHKFKPQRDSVGFRILFLLSILLFGLINYYMFSNSVGITGIDSPRLPFKLSGILYYSSRFIFPLIVTYFFTKFKPTFVYYLLVMFYASFASITSASRSNLVLMFLPVFITAFLYRKYILLFFSIIIMLNFYPVVGFARNYIFAVEKGVSVRDTSYNLVQVISSTIKDYSDEGAIAGLLAIVERVGGGQDVALATQYDNHLVGGPLKEFVRLYVYDFWDMANVAQGNMFDFQFDVAGYSPGDGGFFSHILLVMGNSTWILILLSVYLGVVLGIGNITYNNLKNAGFPRELLIFYSILFAVLFFVFSSPLWFNFFLLSTFILGILADKLYWLNNMKNYESQ